MKNNQDFDILDMVEEYKKELLTFYAPHFEDEKSLMEFVGLALNYDEKYSQVRFMIQQVQRFISLANDIDKIRPGRDPLRVFFLKVCMESLCNISGYSKTVFFDKLEKCFSDEAKSYILSCFEYTGINLPDNLSFEERLEYYEYKNHKFEFKDFLMIIKTVRDIFAHDGDYWSTQFFTYDNESIWVTSITTSDNIFGTKPKSSLTYNFQTKLNYFAFIHYFVEACICFINTFMDEN